MCEPKHLDIPTLLISPSAIDISVVLPILENSRGCSSPPTLAAFPPQMEWDENDYSLQVSRKLFDALLAWNTLVNVEKTDSHSIGTSHAVMVHGDNRCMLFATNFTTSKIFRDDMPCRIVALLPANCQTFKRYMNAPLDTDAEHLRSLLQAAYEEIQQIVDIADFVVIYGDLIQSVDDIINILDRTAEGTECKTYYKTKAIEQVYRCFEEAINVTDSGFPIDEEMLQIRG